MERLILPLGEGITGVVGPNGCGKSNIVDAIRWILGESRASQLRGGVLEDVIFNGSAALRPLGLAEVAITLRPSNDQLSVVTASKDGESNEEVELRRKFFASATEIQVTRRLYRSGESEYFINRVPCRLKDLKDLFREARLGSRGYTIVAQGEVSRIVTSKPEDRRAIIEETAGIAGFREKLAEAKRRLTEAQSGVTRVADLVRELERQVAQLKRQADRAINRQALKSEVATLDRECFIGSLRGSTLRSQELKAELSKATEETLLKEQLLNDLSIKEGTLRGDLSLIERDLEAKRKELDIEREKIAVKERLIYQANSRLEQARSELHNKLMEKRRMASRVSTLEERLVSSIAERDKLEKVELELKLKLQEINRVSNDDLRKLSEELNKARNAFRDIDKDYRGKRERFVAVRSRVQTLEEQVTVGTLQAKLNFAKHKELQNLNTTVSDILKVPLPYAKAVQGVLGERARAFVLLSGGTLASYGEHLLRYFKEIDPKGKNNYGVEIYTVNKSSSLNVVEKEVPFPSLLSLIEADLPYQPLLTELLSNTYLVPDLLSGESFFREHSDVDVTLVTPEGYIFRAHSLHLNGTVDNGIELRGKIRELKEEMNLCEQELLTIQKEREALSSKVTELEREYAHLQREHQRQQHQLRELGREHGMVRGRLEAALRSGEQIKGDITRSKKEIADTEGRISAEEEIVKENEKRVALAVEGSKGEENTLVEKLKEVVTELVHRKTILVTESNTLNDRLGKCRRELNAIRERPRAFSLELEKLRLEDENVRERLTAEYGLPWIQEAIIEAEATLQVDESLKSRKERLQQLRRRIHQEGEVDPQSIDRYQEENLRLQGLLTELRELKESDRLINESIKMLELSAREKFLETYNEVNEKFKELIPKVFGSGGFGELTLSDDKRPLDGGVFINVRPPGKANKSIDLLSGGEKALVATALIMALFSLSPSPLCVLDEVDAPLDEANLLRFLELIKEMSKETQFLMVTHNKRSMAAADRLVGVTMEQPGSSKMVSVKLNDTFEYAANE
jgi:chromosome segregation protein